MKINDKLQLKVGLDDPLNTRLNKCQSEYERERGAMVTWRDADIAEKRKKAAEKRAARALKKKQKEAQKGIPLCDTETGEALV